MGIKRQKVKNCTQCGEKKPFVYFGMRKASADGMNASCKDCMGDSQDKNLNKRIRRWKWGANKRKIEWGLSDSYINSMVKKCYYTGIKLTIKRNKLNTLSLDRKDSAKGYVKNNVVFCCAKINIMKSDLKIDEFIDWCSKIHRHSKRPSKK